MTCYVVLVGLPTAEMTVPVWTEPGQADPDQWMQRPFGRKDRDSRLHSPCHQLLCFGLKK